MPACVLVVRILILVIYVNVCIFVSTPFLAIEHHQQITDIVYKTSKTIKKVKKKEKMREKGKIKRRFKRTSYFVVGPEGPKW
jgi:hypothetical protein